MASWADEILTNVLAVAEVIDGCEENDSYVQSVRQMQELVTDVEATPSARVLADLRETQSSFFEYSFALAESHRDYFAAITALEETPVAGAVEGQAAFREDARIREILGESPVHGPLAPRHLAPRVHDASHAAAVACACVTQTINRPLFKRDHLMTVSSKSLCDESLASRLFCAALRPPESEDSLGYVRLGPSVRWRRVRLAT